MIIQRTRIFKLIKTDMTDASPLKGVGFRIKNSEGNIVYEGYTDQYGNFTQDKLYVYEIDSIVIRSYLNGVDTKAASVSGIKAGDKLDGIGGYTALGSICTAAEADEKGYVPFGLINKNAVMKVDCKKGDLITYDMVELDKNTLIYKLRKEQDAMYGKHVL